MRTTRRISALLVSGHLVLTVCAQWTTGGAFSSSQQFSAALAFDADNALFVNGNVDPWNLNYEGQIVATTSGDQGQGTVFYYTAGTVLEDIDGWAGDTPAYSDSYYWIAGSRRTITNQIRRSMVIRNMPGQLPNPFMEVFTGLNRYYRCIDMVDVDHGFCGGASTAGDGLIDRTNDGGATWERTDSFPGQVISRIRFVNQELGFAVSNGSHWNANSAIDLPDSGHVYRTTDAGESWHTVLSATGTGFSGVWFTDALNGCVTRNDGSIFRTTDGGTNWLATTIELAPPCLLTAVTGTPSGTLYASGYRADNSGAIILSSVDAGASWQLNHFSSTGVGRRINNIYFLNDEVGYAPAWTCIWHTRNGGNVTTALPDAQATTQALLYPSPTSNIVTLELAHAGIQVRVIDLQGRTVIAPFRTTDPRTHFDVSALAAGTYRVVIALEGGTTSLPLHKE
jgi:photosystem II stability/assembly factor-like uncharacterized protein